MLWFHKRWICCMKLIGKQEQDYSSEIYFVIAKNVGIKINKLKPTSVLKSAFHSLTCNMNICIIFWELFWFPIYPIWYSVVRVDPMTEHQDSSVLQNNLFDQNFVLWKFGLLNNIKIRSNLKLLHMVVIIVQFFFEYSSSSCSFSRFTFMGRICFSTLFSL